MPPQPSSTALVHWPDGQQTRWYKRNVSAFHSTTVQSRQLSQGRLFERPGYTASQPWQDAVVPFNTHIVWSALSSLNILPPLTPCVKCCFQHYAHNATHNARNATYAFSGQWHGWILSRDMACIKLEAFWTLHGSRKPCVRCRMSTQSARTHVDIGRRITAHPHASMYDDVRHWSIHFDSVVSMFTCFSYIVPWYSVPQNY